jgi:hypothetical protein
VFVANPGIFSEGDEVHVLSGDSIATSEGEMGVVAELGPDYVDLEAPLELSYPEPMMAPSPPFPYSFIAKRASGYFDVQPSLQELAKAFDEAFTDWYLLPDDGFVPYWPHAEGGIPPDPGLFIDVRSPRFFKHFDNDPMGPRPFRNHVQLVSASRKEQMPAPDADLGLAEHTNQGGLIANNWSWVFSKTIELLGGGNVTNLHDHVTAHELGHQFNVNQGSPQGDGHDNELYWGASGSCQAGGGPSCCLMNEKTVLTTAGVRRFHAGGAAPSQDLLCIRTHVDDLNQDECPAFP